jgi:hypothetical protein
VLTAGQLESAEPLVESPADADRRVGVCSEVLTEGRGSGAGLWAGLALRPRYLGVRRRRTMLTGVGGARTDSPISPSRRGGGKVARHSIR